MLLEDYGNGSIARQIYTKACLTLSSVLSCGGTEGMVLESSSYAAICRQIPGESQAAIKCRIADPVLG
jgi:hypothetical protein